MKSKNAQTQKPIKKMLEQSLDNMLETNLYFEYINSKGLEGIQQKILEKMNCRHCGWCCNSCNCMITEDDIMALCKHLKCTFDEFYGKYMDNETILNYLKFPCPFLESTGEVRDGIDVKRCVVYEVRPEVCKRFPFNGNLLVVYPCLIGKEIIEMMQKELGIKKVLNKEDERTLTKKEMEEHKKNDEQAKKVSATHDVLSAFLPQFNSVYGHLIAVMNKPLLEKTIKVLNKKTNGEKI